MTQTPTVSKLLGETVTLKFDFLELLRFGESISSPVVTVTVVSGLDYSPEDILDGAASVSGTTVSQKVTAGMAGVTYVVSCRVNGTSPAQYVTVRTLAILSDTSSFYPSNLPSMSGDLPDGIVGAAYSGDLLIAGGYAPYSAESPTGSAPAWMGYTVVDDTLVCAGTPGSDSEASYTFTPRIADAGRNFAGAPQVINFTRITVAGDLGDQSVGATPVFSYTASGGTPPYRYALYSGALPTGLSLLSSGAVSQTITGGGSFSWVVRGTDANGITDDHADSANVTSTSLYAGVGNAIYLLKAVSGGTSFAQQPDNTGVVSSGTNSVWAAGGKLYHYSFGADTDYSLNGAAWNATSGIQSGANPCSNLIVVDDEVQAYLVNGLFNLYFSAAGIAFTQRTIPGGEVRKPVVSGTTVLGVDPANSGGLARSTDGGSTFNFYTVSGYNATANASIQRLLKIPEGWVIFGRDTSGNMRIGFSATGVDAPSWTHGAGPANSPVHGVSRRPDGRVLIVLSTGASYYSDVYPFVWQAGPSFTYAGAPAVTSIPNEVNNLYYSPSCAAWFFAAPQGGGVTRIYRLPDDMSAWTNVYATSGGRTITSFAEF